MSIASLCSCTVRLGSGLVVNPENSFSRDMAHNQIRSLSAVLDLCANATLQSTAPTHVPFPAENIS